MDPITNLPRDVHNLSHFLRSPLRADNLVESFMMVRDVMVVVHLLDSHDSIVHPMRILVLVRLRVSDDPFIHPMMFLVLVPLLVPDDPIIHPMMVLVLHSLLVRDDSVILLMDPSLLLLLPFPLVAALGIGNFRKRRTSLSPILVPFGEGGVEAEWERRRAWRRRRGSDEQTSRGIAIRTMDDGERVRRGEDGSG